jgi:ketosteroid isomerase-like protein
VKATGRKATWSGAWFWTIRDGRIAEGKVTKKQ